LYNILISISNKSEKERIIEKFKYKLFNYLDVLDINEIPKLINYNHDLILLEFGEKIESELDISDIINKIREINKLIPIIVISENNNIQDKVYLFNLGIDDYISKPYSLEELIARIEAFIRKIKLIQSSIDIKPKSFNNQEVVRIGNSTIFLDKMIIKTGNEVFHLKNKELEVLKLLLKNKGNVMSRDFIMKEIWGRYEFLSDRVIDIIIVSLRKKLKDNARNPKYIKTINGVGYKLEDEI